MPSAIRLDHGAALHIKACTVLVAAAAIVAVTAFPAAGCAPRARGPHEKLGRQPGRKAGGREGAWAAWAVTYCVRSARRAATHLQVLPRPPQAASGNPTKPDLEQLIARGRQPLGVLGYGQLELPPADNVHRHSSHCFTAAAQQVRPRRRHLPAMVAAAVLPAPYRPMCPLPSLTRRGQLGRRPGMGGWS